MMPGFLLNVSSTIICAPTVTPLTVIITQPRVKGM